MSLQHIVRTLLTTLLLCVGAAHLHAKYYAEVGTSTKVSALPVFASQPQNGTPVPTEVGDTIKSFDQLAKELMEEESRGESTSDPDSITAPIDSARLRHIADSLTAHAPQQKPTQKPQFVPNPNKALWLSLVFPGAGQIYNRKYWKLPIIYGGFLGCTYALMWNQMMYRDYSQAYLDIMDDDPNTKSYMEMLPPRYDITGREEQFKNLFKRKKDYYRRYRDLSAFCFVGVYLLSVIDAYVDAQLSVFDISPDLSMKVKPAVIGAPNMLGSTNRAAYGVGCSLNF